ncbi:uncharacterized protein LOC134197439 [Corticium candelabrum]|uniref:uncharacterized protein LOC134197439 n=1 Tax=Corticium candelabrum TaxID=121492 RepID=UPI002E259649|nr:uncharacterized protein LOC134197439 [Corticium candelabrum]
MTSFCASLFVFSSLLHASIACQQLGMYKPIPESAYDLLPASSDDISKNPYGYYVTSLPSIEDTATPDPCVQIMAPAQYMVEIMMQAVTGSFQICGKDDSSDPVEFCGAGEVRYCGAIPKNNPTYTFFCENSCETSDNSFFFYRFYIQNSTELVQDPQDWCQNRNPSEFPKSLQRLPDSINNVPDAPKDRDVGLGAGIISSPSFFVIFISLFTLLLTFL